MIAHPGGRWKCDLRGFMSQATMRRSSAYGGICRMPAREADHEGAAVPSGWGLPGYRFRRGLSMLFCKEHSRCSVVEITRLAHEVVRS